VLSVDRPVAGSSVRVPPARVAEESYRDDEREGKR
jgi:hypothetical protein